MRTYLVGRSNTTQPCDIALPSDAISVSRRHMELSVADDGRYYVVHLHPRNFTKVKRGGEWQTITQDYVEADEPLLLGDYQTTARKLLTSLGGPSSLRQAPTANAGSAVPQWDAECVTIKRPRQ